MAYLKSHGRNSFLKRIPVNYFKSFMQCNRIFVFKNGLLGVKCDKTTLKKRVGA